MQSDERRFSTQLPGSVIRDLRDEKERSDRSLKVITAAFIRHCLDMATRERDAIVREYLGEGAPKRTRSRSGSAGRPRARTQTPGAKASKVAAEGTPEEAALRALDGTALDFDQDADIRQLAARQGVTSGADFDALLGDFWPEDESADDFVASVRAWRRRAR